MRDAGSVNNALPTSRRLNPSGLSLGWRLLVVSFLIVASLVNVIVMTDALVFIGASIVTELAIVAVGAVLLLVCCLPAVQNAGMALDAPSDRAIAALVSILLLTELAFGIADTINYAEFSAHAVPSTGTIVSVSPHNHSTFGYTYVVGDRLRDGSASIEDVKPYPVVGEKIPVLYDRRWPQYSEAAHHGNGALALFILVSPCVLFYVFLRKRLASLGKNRPR